MRPILTLACRHSPMRAACRHSSIISHLKTNGFTRVDGPERSRSESYPYQKLWSGVDMRLTAGGVRELHWHTAAEWAIMLYGSARITAIDDEGRSFVRDTDEGDLWYFPTGIPHSIQGLGPDGAEFLLVFDDGGFSEYATVLLSEWMAHTPREVLAKNFGTSSEALARMPIEELFIFQSEIPPPLAAD